MMPEKKQINVNEVVFRQVIPVVFQYSDTSANEDNSFRNHIR